MKHTIRKKILSDRQNMSSELSDEKSKSIASIFLDSDYYKKSDVIMVYLDCRNEVCTKDIIEKALQDGKRIVVPISIVDTKQLLLSELLDFENDLAPGSYNILEPKEECIRAVCPSLVDLVLVPGVAFDEKGYRIGYGAGYYDRFFERISPDVPKVALSYNLQMVDHAHPDDHDYPVDSIVTEDGIINCR